MPNLLARRLTQNHMRAVFGTSAAFFDMSRVATFEDLADRLSNLGERHDGALVSVNIEAEQSAESRSVEAASWRQYFAGDAPTKAIP